MVLAKCSFKINFIRIMAHLRVHTEFRLDLGALLHVGFLIRLELLDDFISARLSGCLAHMQVFFIYIP